MISICTRSDRGRKEGTAWNRQSLLYVSDEICEKLAMLDLAVRDYIKAGSLSFPISPVSLCNAEQRHGGCQQDDDAECVEALIEGDCIKFRRNVKMNQIERCGVNHELEWKENPAAHRENGLF